MKKLNIKILLLVLLAIGVVCGCTKQSLELAPTHEAVESCGKRNLDREGYTFENLIQAIKCDNSEEVERLVESNRIDLSTQDENGMTALHHAVNSKNTFTVLCFNSILRATPKAALILQDKKTGNTPLDDALIRQNQWMVIKLIEANIEACSVKNRQNKIPLHYACEQDLSFRDYLLQHCSQKFCLIEDEKNNTPIEYGIFFTMSELKRLKKLLKKEIWIKITNSLLHNVLKESLCYKKKLELVQWLIAQGANKNSVDKKGCNILYVCLQNSPPRVDLDEDYHDFVKYLTQTLNINPYQADHEGTTPIHLARDHSEPIQVLMQKHQQYYEAKQRAISEVLTGRYQLNPEGFTRPPLHHIVQVGSGRHTHYEIVGTQLLD